MKAVCTLIALVSAAVLCFSAGLAQQPVRVGSKNFTEQFILGELYARALAANGIKTEKKQRAPDS
jgi:osmoprotectant transport system substrate-binding protein